MAVAEFEDSEKPRLISQYLDFCDPEKGDKESRGRYTKARQGHSEMVLEYGDIFSPMNTEHPQASCLTKLSPDPTFYFLNWICSFCRRCLEHCVLVHRIAGWTSRPARSLWLSAPSHSAWHSTAQQTTVTTAAGNTNTPTKKCIRRVFFVATTLQDGNKKKCPSQHPQYLVLKIAKKCFFPKKYSKPPVKAFV